MKVAALDLGTNSFLCLIVEVKDGAIQALYHDTAEVVRLGQDVDKKKAFQPEALQRAEECLKRFAKIIEKHKPEKVLAMATSAARDVTNADELFKICESLKIPVQIIPGDREASITFKGAVSNFPDDDKVRVVLDIGGGSTEMIRGTGHRLEFGESVNIGAVRLTEKLVLEQPLPPQDREVILKYAQEQLEELAKKISEKKIDQIIAVAGTPTELAKIEFGEFDPRKIEGHKISLDKLNRYLDMFGNTSVQDRIDQLKVSEGRADIIFCGTAILKVATELLGQTEITVSTRGVRYGVALEMENEAKP